MTNRTRLVLSLDIVITYHSLALDSRGRPTGAKVKTWTELHADDAKGTQDVAAGASYLCRIQPTRDGNSYGVLANARRFATAGERDSFVACYLLRAEGRSALKARKASAAAEVRA